MNARADGLPRTHPISPYAYGITTRKRRKPFIVKFKRNKKTIYVGSYATVAEAKQAQTDFLLKETM